MCTLTYFPLKLNNDETQLVITANRDESPLRGADKYIRESWNNFMVWYPSEPVAGGTNFIVSGNGKVATLLNGAFHRHDHVPPYRISRGLMVLSFLKSKSMKNFLEEYDLKGIEPFTLVSFEDEIAELRWDGKESYLEYFSYFKPRIWSSTQLYERPVRERREDLFDEFLKDNSIITPQKILDFHFNAGTGDEINDFVMNRNDLVKTVSISQVLLEKSTMKDSIKIHHFDLLNKKDFEVDLK